MVNITFTLASALLSQKETEKYSHSYFQKPGSQDINGKEGVPTVTMMFCHHTKILNLYAYCTKIISDNQSRQIWVKSFFGSIIRVDTE
jgi:hypothetical protein